MTYMVMVSYGTQALALAHHTYGLALLVRSQMCGMDACRNLSASMPVPSGTGYSLTKR